MGQQHKYVDINEVLAKGFKDDKEDEIIQQCIETMFFDESKREQTHSKLMIRESFGWLLHQNCKLCDVFFLEQQLPDITMRIKELKLTDENQCRVLV